jgi:hypothetical protein
MVASPNVDFGGANGLANFLQDMQRQIDENGRRSTYPFSAGPMGTFQIYPDPTIVDATGKPVVDTVLKYGDGTTALSIRPGLPQYGSKQQMVMRDLAGRAMYATDESAGYGLIHPSFAYHMTGIESAGPNLPTAAPGVAVAQGTNFIYNPTWHIMCRLRFSIGANALNATATVKVVGTDGTVYGSTSSTFTAGANAFYVPTFEKMILLPAVAMNTRCYAEISVYVAPGDTTTSVQGFPTMSVGVSKAWYDLYPLLH